MCTVRTCIEWDCARTAIEHQVGSDDVLEKYQPFVLGNIWGPSSKTLIDQTLVTYPIGMPTMLMWQNHFAAAPREYVLIPLHRNTVLCKRLWGKNAAK